MLSNMPSARNSSRVDRPRSPYPLIWCPRHRGTYLVITGLGGAP
jgi:hypothetical protein